MADRFQSELARRGRAAFALGVTVLLVSTGLYYSVGCLTGMNAGYGKRLLSLADDRWELTECLYASVITLTTVGYTDLLGTERLEIWRDAAGRHRWVSPTDGHEEPGFDAASATLLHDWSPLTRGVSILQAVVGIAFFLYVIAQVTSFFVEGAYEEIRGRRRALRRLARMRDHVIVCGAGEHGRQVVAALRDEGIPCAAVDHAEDPVAALREAHEDVPVLLADASEEATLRQAGLERARGVCSVLGDDGMNVVLAVTVRQLRPDLALVSRAFGQVSARRLAAAGSGVVTSGRLAAMRLASEMVRPTAVAFLDRVLRGESGGALRLQDVFVGPRFAGRRLAESDDVGVVPLALRRAAEDHTVYNPDDDERLGAGDLLTVLGTPGQLAHLHELLDSAAVGETALVVGEEDFDAPRAGGAGAPADTREGHFVLCGLGETGSWIARELHATRRPFVAVESSAEVLERMREEIPGLAAVQGDAQDPETLRAAGVEGARGLASTMASDRVNLLTVVTARQAQPGLRAVSLVADDGAARRLRRAGVGTVSKARIGGRRMAAELVRPQLTTFLERMLGDERGIRVECARVRAGAPGAGRSLGELDLRRVAGVRPVAVRVPDGGFLFDPGPEVRLEPEARLVLIAGPAELERVVALLGAYE